MPQEKTFDRADLVRFFWESGFHAIVGRLQVLQPTPTLFGETEMKRYPVEAETVALWCERYRFAIVVQSVAFPDGGREHLPPHHPLRHERRVTVRYGDGGSSAQLVRWAAELADTYRAEMRGHIPVRTIDLTGSDDAPTLWGVADAANAQAAAAPSDETGSTGDAALDDDHTPTGTSIDDVLRDDDGGAVA